MATVNVYPLNVYKHMGSTCSNRGVTEFYDELLLICDWGPFEADECEENLVVMQVREIAGEKFAELVPLALKDRWTMPGGAFAGTSDSRFARMAMEATGYPCRGVLPVFDRLEG